jgi:hypothetical protein
VALSDVLKVVREAHNELGNLHSKSMVFSELPGNYLTWVHENVRMWRHRVAPADIDRLLHTPRYWAIQAAPGAASAKLAETEIADRQVVLGEIVTWLEGTKTKWERSPGRLVVADTSVYCHHEDRVENISFTNALDIHREHPVRLMVPILVLDELEGLKQSSKARTRWRAAHTLGKFDEVLHSSGVGMLRTEDETPTDRPDLAGPVHVEVFFDPTGHRRLPLNDDELIERALAIQAESGKDVTFLTFDTAQSTRAKFAGLAVKKLKEDPGPEPTNP